VNIRLQKGNAGATHSQEQLFNSSTTLGGILQMLEKNIKIHFNNDYNIYYDFIMHLICTAPFIYCVKCSLKCFTGQNIKRMTNK